MGLKLSIEGLMDGSKCTGFCTEYFGFSCVPKSHVEHMICLISIVTTIYNLKKKKKRYRTHGFKLGRGNNSAPALSNSCISICLLHA